MNLQMLNKATKRYKMEVSLSEWAGADPGFLLGGCALVSCSTSTPINHIVFFGEYQLTLRAYVLRNRY